MLTKSRSYSIGRVTAAAAICAVLLGACGSATSGRGASPRATLPSVSGSTAPRTAGAITTQATAASWLRCEPGQLRARFIPLGAATGHVGAEVVVRNVSGSDCRLFGYPGLKMRDARGETVPTTVSRGGSFLFPAVAPHLVGLAPGQKASFDLEYGDNPTGNPPPTYQKACPAATALEITLPDDNTAVSARVTMAPCNGDVTVSPVVPGTAPIRFS